MYSFLFGKLHMYTQTKFCMQVDFKNPSFKIRFKVLKRMLERSLLLLQTLFSSGGSRRSLGSVCTLWVVPQWDLAGLEHVARPHFERVASGRCNRPLLLGDRAPYFLPGAFWRRSFLSEGSVIMCI